MRYAGMPLDFYEFNYYLPSGTKGAMGEYLVCVDLLNKGYEVFRSVSPNTSCDLVILKDGKLRTLEVKVGKQRKTGEADIWATVTFDKIFYEPSL